MLDEFDIPIFKKAYDLYLYVYGLRESAPKQNRYALWLRVEKVNLDVIEKILHASALYKAEKIEVLERASIDLNMLRVFVRIAKDTKVLDVAKYAKIQQQIDEIECSVVGLSTSKERKKKAKAPRCKGALL